MFLIRNAKEADLNDLFELASFENFINLPANRDELKRLINLSNISFQKPNKNLFKNYYIFVLEDTSTNSIIGTSMIHAQHGTEEIPHYFLKVGTEHRFSSTLNTGFVHGTLKLGLETNGPTEIGGLIVHPNYRKFPIKLGKQLSFVRFLFMGLYPSLFKKEILSELLPPFDSEGNSPLWEAVGRKFMNMDYPDADRLSQTNKEFILNLFPSEIIYTTLLPVDARNSIGQVGEKTKPVKKMLENIGFKYSYEVDPFDGGPHYRCQLSEVSLIKEKKTGTIVFAKKNQEKNDHINSQYLIQIPTETNHFLATAVNLNVDGDRFFLHEKNVQVAFPDLEGKSISSIKL